jgi:hypothetical protein
LVKTFFGWQEKQLPDGTLILTSPAGQTYVTTRAARCCFRVCAIRWAMPAAEADPGPQDCCGRRTAMMPNRRRTRARDHASRVATERRHNRDAHLARRAAYWSGFGPAPPPDDNDDPPPL